MTRLRLHMVAAPVHTLGPYARFGIWVQGCMKNCPGCVTLDARPLYGGYEMDVDTLARLVLRRPDIEGLTISGGEPFLQGDALYRLILKIRCAADIGVILYTGYAYEEIGGQPLAGQCDAIIDGPYLADLDDGRSLRGFRKSAADSADIPISGLNFLWSRAKNYGMDPALWRGTGAGWRAVPAGRGEGAETAFLF